jgi:hypothetical protein
MATQNILSAFLKALDEITPTIQTKKPNLTFAPTIGQPYQRVRLLPTAPENPTVGDDYHRENGIFEVILFYPIGNGTAAALTRAELIKNKFTRGTHLVQNGQVINILRTPYVGPEIEGPDYYAVPISIEYFSENF